MKNDNQFGYFPVNETAIASGFYLTGAGVENVRPGENYPLPSHPDMYQFTWNDGRVLPEFQLIYLDSGAGEFESRETGRMPIYPGTIMVLLPDVWHRYRPDIQTGWTACWISFNGQLPHFWQQTGLFSSTSTIFPDMSRKLPMHKLEKIVQCAIASPGNPGAASLSTLAFLAEMLSMVRFVTAELPATASEIDMAWPSDPLLRQALELIWNHSHRDLSVKVIARQLGVTGRTLERHFRKALGKTVHQELTACRVARAELMLRYTHLPIKRIAYASGFSSPTHLSVVFQRQLRKTPGEIRGPVKVKP